MKKDTSSQTKNPERFFLLLTIYIRFQMFNDSLTNPDWLCKCLIFLLFMFFSNYLSSIIHQPLGSRNLSFSDEYPPNLPRNRGDFKGEMAHTSFVKTDKIPRLFVLFFKFQTRRPKNFLQQKLKLKHKHKEALLPNRYKSTI